MIPFFLFNFFLFGLVLILLFDEFLARVFLVGLFPVSDEFADVVPLLLEGVEAVPDFPPDLILLDDSVDEFGIPESAFQAFADDVGVVSLLCSKPIDI